METVRLKQFCVISELGSMSKAAKVLHISHSGLSKSIKTLERELGSVLFQPSGRGLELTEFGKKIYEKSKEFLSLEQRLFTREEEVRNELLNIGTVEIFLIALTKGIESDSFIGKEVALFDICPGQIEQQVAAKKIDYGITYVPYPMSGIDIIPLFEFELGCYHRKDVFKSTPFSKIPFVVPTEPLADNPLGIKARDGWLDEVTARHKKYRVNLLSSALSLTEQGLSAIYIPKFIAKLINSDKSKSRQLIEIPVDDEQPRSKTAYLLKRKGKPSTQDENTLKMLLKDLMAVN